MTRITLGAEPWSVEQVMAIARGEAQVAIDNSPSWRNKISASRQFLEQLWQEGTTVYGVTTGFGDSCGQSIPEPLVEELPVHLMRFHGCGMGQHLSPELGRAVLAVRAKSLCSGFSGVRLELLEQLTTLLNRDIVPVIPEEGSVGASGDLTPLSYVAAVLMGEREVYYKGQRRSTAEVFQEEAIAPVGLRPKEGLAVMNGTAVMTALACAAYQRAAYLTRLTSRITALTVEVLQANRNHFNQRLFAAKPYPGQAQIARWIREDLGDHSPTSAAPRLQAHYSIRCAPHVIGVLADALPWMKQHIETELNSANDNPLIDAELEQVLHGGHFYGGHIAFVMDSMKKRRGKPRRPDGSTDGLAGGTLVTTTGCPTTWLELQDSELPSTTASKPSRSLYRPGPLKLSS